jgi:TusA-related sulfurtransferase
LVPAASEKADMTHHAFDQVIDITADLCPMTFVRTRLALDRMAAGAVLKVRLKGREPQENVPATAISLGHRLLHQETGADGVTELWLRRG